MQITKRQFLAGSSAFTGSLAVWSVTALGAELEPIIAAHSVNVTLYAPHMVAKAMGFAEKAGLELRLIEAQGGSNVRKIVAAGQVGYALGDSGNPLQLTNRGRRTKILMATDNRCSYANIIVRRELYDQGFDTVEKLAEYRPDGQKPVIAATNIGAGTWLWGTYVLETLGVGDQFNWIGGGASKTMLGGLKAGKFDAIMGVPSWIFRIEDDGYGKLIYDISNADSWNRVFGGNIPASVVYLLEETAIADPELTQKYVNAIYRSMLWLGAATIDEIHAVVGPLMPGFTPDVIKREIAYYKEIWQYSGDFPEADFERGARVWFREKTKIEPLAYAAAVDLSFLENAKKA